MVDLTDTLPLWFPVVSGVATSLLFCWWLLRDVAVERAWLVRPSFADGRTA